jgi:hypothetical protein
VYGRLLVVDFAGRSNNGHARWRCLCECGALTTVDGSHLRAGLIQSCRCLQRELLGEQNIKRFAALRRRKEKAHGKGFKSAPRAGNRLAQA